MSKLREDFTWGEPINPAEWNKTNREVNRHSDEVASNSAIIKSLQEMGIPQGEEYSFTFLEESAMEGLNSDNTVGFILYFGMEEEDTAPVVDISGNTISVSNGVTLTGNTVTLAGVVYSGNTVTSGTNGAQGTDVNLNGNTASVSGTSYSRNTVTVGGTSYNRNSVNL